MARSASAGGIAPTSALQPAEADEQEEAMGALVARVQAAVAAALPAQAGALLALMPAGGAASARMQQQLQQQQQQAAAVVQRLVESALMAEVVGATEAGRFAMLLDYRIREQVALARTLHTTHPID